MTEEQIDELEHLVADAAAPLPSIMELLGITDTNVHLGTVRELIRTVDDRMSKVADVAGCLQLSGEGKSSGRAMTTVSHLDVEDVAIRLDTVVSTLQILIETYDQRDPDLAAALAGQRCTVAEQSHALNKMVTAMCGEKAAERLDEEARS